jgi:hypothetical protein
VKNKFILLFSISLLLQLGLLSQTTWSISTDFSAIRSMKKNQQFWSVGHTIRSEAHLTKKDGPYVWVSYFIPGKFKNNLTAEAKTTVTNPQTILFQNKANMSLRQFNIGWKHYFKGGANTDGTWNLYGMAGFGVIDGKMKNTFQTVIDTSLYNIPVMDGQAGFKRLTIDLGLGWEALVSGDIYLYNELKVWIPTTDYPTKFLLANSYAPLIASLHIGIRIYFE